MSWWPHRRHTSTPSPEAAAANGRAQESLRNAWEHYPEIADLHEKARLSRQENGFSAIIEETFRRKNQ